jgi:hypothetical protein
MLCRYNLVSESDLANALDRVSHYVAERAQEAPRIRPIHGEPAQSDHDGHQQRSGSGANPAKEKMAAGWIEQPT